MTLARTIDYARRGRGRRGRPAQGWESLSPVQVDVATLAAQGLSNPRIGERLFISRGTVKAHLTQIYRKLGVDNRTQLAALSRENRRTDEAESRSDEQD
jgi:DNA-binding CsgD family transcriptional regulator